MKHFFLDCFIKRGLYQFVSVSFFVFMMLVNNIGFSSIILAKENPRHVKSIHRKKVKKSVSVRTKHRIQHKQSKVANQPVGHSIPSVNGVVAGAAAGAAASSVISASRNAAIAEPEKGSVTGLPLPHFLSLRADEVNMRAGPGARYPILWIYHRRHMPVKVLREFDVWRLIEDVDGQKGWIQQAILSRERFFIITGSPLTVTEAKIVREDSKTKSNIKHTDSYITGYIANDQTFKSEGQSVILRNAPQETANPVAVLKPGTIGSIKECPLTINWCKVKILSYTGWIPRTSFWGLLPQETIQPH